MIQATILLTFKDGITINYANKFLTEKTGKDAKGNTILTGIPGACYYYTGFEGDAYEDQSGAGKLAGDFDTFKKQIGGTGNVQFPEKTVAHDNTDEYVRETNRDLTTSLPKSRGVFKAEDLVSVSVTEKWITFSGDDLDRESRELLPQTSNRYIDFEDGPFKESEHTPSHDIYHKPMDAYFVTDNNGFIPNPELALTDDKELVVLNKYLYKSTVSKKFPNGYECYGIVDVKKPLYDSLGNIVINPKNHFPQYEIVGTKNSGVSFIQFPVEKPKTEVIPPEPAPEETVPEELTPAESSEAKKEEEPVEVKEEPKPVVKKSTKKAAPKTVAPKIDEPEAKPEVFSLEPIEEKPVVKDTTKATKTNKKTTKK